MDRSTRNSYPPQLLKFYVEKINQYGIYQGSIVDPTYKYDKLLLGDRDNEQYHL